MKTAISIPDPTFREAEALAKRLGVSRSQLYSRAVEKFIEAQRKSRVTDRLNDVYAVEPSDLDAILSAMQFASLPKEEW